MTSSYHHQMMSPRRWTQSIVGRTAEGRAQCQEAAATKVYCLCGILVRVGLKTFDEEQFSLNLMLCTSKHGVPRVRKWGVKM